jgi:hypothetical protein
MGPNQLTSPFFLITAFLMAVLFVASTDLMAAEEGKIYRSRDANGNVIFSDKAKASADEIEVAEPMTYQAPKITQKLSPPIGQDIDSFSYLSITITSPKIDEAIRSNNGALTVSFTVKPPLQSGHSVQLILDGNLEQSTQDSTRFELDNVDRGTHSILLNIVDEKTRTVIKSSSIINTTILRYSILINPRVSAKQSRGD